MMDTIDQKILKLIQKNARISNVEVARQVKMAPSAVLERIRKLEDQGIVKGYTAQLNPSALGLALLAFVYVRTNDRVGRVQTATLLARIPEVQEVHHVAGEDCYLVKVRTTDTEALGRLLREQFGSIKSVVSTRTTIVLETVKDTPEMPIRLGAHS